MADVHELLSVWIENVKDEELFAELKAMKEGDGGDNDRRVLAGAPRRALACAGTLGAGTTA